MILPSEVHLYVSLSATFWAFCSKFSFVLFLGSFLLGFFFLPEVFFSFLCRCVLRCIFLLVTSGFLPIRIFLVVFDFLLVNHYKYSYFRRSVTIH